VISFPRDFTLTEFEVSEGPHAPTLLLGARNSLQKCVVAKRIGHEICVRRTAARHGQPKRGVRTAAALGTVQGVRVPIKPFINVTQLRDDIRIIASDCSDHSSEDITITVVSLASQISQTAVLPVKATDDDSAIKQKAKLVEKHLKVMSRARLPRSNCVL
jgi:hypothetical protein